MRRRLLCATIGSTLGAISLCGSTWRSDNPTAASSAELALFNQGNRFFQAGEYSQAMRFFRSAAIQAEQDASPDHAAMNWNNVGAAALARMNFRDALPAFEKAKTIARASHQTSPELAALNNIADLYVLMGNPAEAMRRSKEALSRTSNASDPAVVSKLQFHLATSLSLLHRFDEAEPIYRLAIATATNEAVTPPELETLARMLGRFGEQCLNAGRVNEAEDALSEGLRLVRTHNLNASANILRALGNLRARQGDASSAAALFAAALESRQSLTPRWVLYADRAEFRLSHNDFVGALDDFRQARADAAQMRADVVPTDGDRIALATGLNRIPAGLVDAGNRLAQKTGDAALIRETFDAAEQDRLWTLRELFPSASDWRSRLPENYWDQLSHYQSVERELIALLPADPKSGVLRTTASSLEHKLQEFEAGAADPAHPAGDTSGSVLEKARRHLGPDSVLFSFHITDARGWLWAVDAGGVNLYSVPSGRILKPRIQQFVAHIRTGDTLSQSEGEALYKDLLGHVPGRYRRHKGWLLVPDGPLFDIPFGALVTGHRASADKSPIYLAEIATLQSIPGASIIEKRSVPVNDAFLGIGDPVYNGADPRYAGERVQEVSLPRLPGTAEEIQACSRMWNAKKSVLLTGPDARLDAVRQAMRDNPAIIHFATHVVEGPTSHSSGLIALGLDANGQLGLMGPTEIQARPITASLVVLDGCHSAASESLPGVGLMGLTRAWIGAGARAVMATQWDIPDDAGAAMMVEFYRALRAHPAQGPAGALQQAQIHAMRAHTPPSVWAPYFVLGRDS